MNSLIAGKKRRQILLLRYLGLPLILLLLYLASLIKQPLFYLLVSILFGFLGTAGTIIFLNDPHVITGGFHIHRFQISRFLRLFLTITALVVSWLPALVFLFSLVK